MDMNSFSLKGKVAWVTGASYGIGMAICKAYHDAGAKVIFNTSRQESVDKGLEEYRNCGMDDIEGYVCDVRDEEAVKALADKIVDKYGRLDILVNNAGCIKRIPMTEMSAEDFRAVVDLDLNAPFICAKAVIPQMIKQGGGKIINICSMMHTTSSATASGLVI